MKNHHYSRLEIPSSVLLLCIALNSCSSAQITSPLITPTTINEIAATPSVADSKQLTATMTSKVPQISLITPTKILTPTFTNIPSDTSTLTPSTETFELKVTEEELTEIVDSDFSSREEAAMENTSVVLRNNTIEIHSQVTQMGFTLPMEVILTVSAESCEPKAVVESAQAGPFPLPDYGKEGMMAMVRGILLDKVQTISKMPAFRILKLKKERS